MTISQTRFTPSTASLLREEIKRCGGIEVFAIGTLNEEGLVADLSIHCRGNQHAVPALLSRPKAGEVVIHNHPSGLLQASNADMYLANLYGEDGVGVVIVNNQVDRALWVVEPHTKKLNRISPDDILRFFEQQLPKAIPNFEVRTGQIDMALHVAEALNNGDVSILEAGTGTGKSLAYLLPATLWALKNDTKVAVATFTITLQSQLVLSDIPILKAAGLQFEHALIKGRNNYLCRRRTGEAIKNNPKDPTIQAISQYIKTATEGSKSDMAFPIPEDIWDEVGSDHDQTLRARCPHFNQCFYYEARRQAAKSHILVANHHLLLADMLVKSETGNEGILPKFNRAIIDEGHHLEDAATALFRQQLSSRSIKRAVRPLIMQKKKPGALEKIAFFHLSHSQSLSEDKRISGLKIVDELNVTLPKIHKESEFWFQQIACDTLSKEVPSFRIKSEFAKNPLWNQSIEPTLVQASLALGEVSDKIAQLEELLEDLPEEIRLQEIQPLLSIQKSRKRLAAQSGFLQSYKLIGQYGGSIQQDPTVRWVEKAKGRYSVPTAQLSMAPIEVGPTLQENLFSKLKAIATCSATMTVNQQFHHYKTRVGLKENPTLTITEALFPSPFDYKRQAVLGIPTDLPPPNTQDFLEKAGTFISQAIECCQGGVFVLCTSFHMLRKLHSIAQRNLKGQYRLFKQGQMGRVQLLDTFLKTPNSVLFGADSFWEGVSVQGKALRMVIIPKLPFRVPTEPVEQARHELMVANGLNPFTQYSLPQAALKLRQGFGRLIRTQNDRGAVLILDSRIKQKWYGRTFLRSLPSMSEYTLSSLELLNILHDFFPKEIGTTDKAWGDLNWI